MGQKLVFLVLLAVVGISNSLSILRAGESVEFAAGEILLKFKEGTSEAEQQNIFKKYSLKKIQFNPTIKTYLTIAKEDDVTIKVSQLNQEPSVEYAQPNYVKKKNTTPNDPYYSSQWHLPHIGMPTAWSEFTGTTLVRVAVIDSGVNKALTDLSGSLISDREWDYISGDSDANDTDGHGTLVAGIIAATANNNLGIAGISSTSRILPFRQDGFVSDINDAMVRAYNSGCKIINASYGGYIENPAERSQLSWLNDRGVLVICSAGNDGTNNDTRRHYPCGYDLPNIISVANSTSSSVLSPSSNYGSTTVDIAAPGTSIFSTLGVGEDNREIISRWTFDGGWDGWVQSNVSGYGFYWSSSSRGLFSDFDTSWQYRANSNVALQSPLIDCRNFVATEIFTMASGSLGIGDALGIYSGTSTLASSTRAALLTGSVNADYRNRTVAMDQTQGRIWYWFTSDSFFNGFFGILYADLTGIPIYSPNSGTSFAAPIVTGVAAMLMSQNPNLTHLQIKEIILQTARKVSALNGKVVSGGIVDATAALREAKARIVVNPPVIQNPAPLTGEIGTFFSYNINASNTPHSFGASGLPPGLTINTTTGLISGTPTQPGSFSVTISASNSAGTGSATITLSVLKNTPTVTSIPVASNIYDGQPLSDSVISGGSFNVEGSFLWANPHIIPTDADSFQEIIFIPSDTSRYNNVNLSIPISVIEAPDHIRSLASCEIKIILPSSLVYDGTQKEISATASPTNVSSKREKKLVHVGNSSTGYGTISGLGPEGFRSVTNLGVNGVFRPHQSSTLISTTGLRYSFPANLVSASPGGDSLRPPWKKNADSTGGATGSLTSHFTALGINWSSNSLFAVPSAGITFDLNEIQASGKAYTRFSTYFAMHSGNPAGDAAYAVLLDGALVKSGQNFSLLNQYSGLIEVDIPEGSRFLTLVVGDNGDDMHWDHCVFVNPTLYANAQIPLLIQYEGINTTTYGPTTNPPTNAGDYRLTFSDPTGRYTGSYTTNVGILKVTPVIYSTPTASSLTYGQALAASILTGGVASVPGIFTFTTPNAVPNAGSSPQSITFTPTDTNNYNNVLSSVNVTISKATPEITWEPPAVIFGTPLTTNNVINAAANAPGSFGYAIRQKRGVVFTDRPFWLNAGTNSNSLVLRFLPDNINNYTPIPLGGISRDLVLLKATPVVNTSPSASPITVGQSLSSSRLTGGSVTIPSYGGGAAGSWSWAIPSNIPALGTSSHQVVFQATPTNNYNAVTSTINIEVWLPAPSITRLPAASPITFGQALSNSVLSNGVASAPGNWSWEAPATAPNAGTKGRFPIVFTPANTATHRPITTNVPLVVNKAPQTITFTLPATNAFTSNGLIPLNGTSSSGLPVAYRSRSTRILTITGTNAVMKGRGTTTITASQAGNSNYLAASNVVRAIVVQ